MEEYDKSQYWGQQLQYYEELYNVSNVAGVLYKNHLLFKVKKVHSNMIEGWFYEHYREQNRDKKWRLPLGKTPFHVSFDDFVRVLTYNKSARAVLSSRFRDMGVTFKEKILGM